METGRLSTLCRGQYYDQGNRAVQVSNLARTGKKVNFIMITSMSNEPHFGRRITSRSRAPSL
jgi:hypothetical protein